MTQKHDYNLRHFNYFERKFISSCERTAVVCESPVRLTSALLKTIFQFVNIPREVNNLTGEQKNKSEEKKTQEKQRKPRHRTNHQNLMLIVCGYSE